MTARWTIVLIGLLLVGCVQFNLVSPERRTIGGVYSLDPQITWSSWKQGKTEFWTVDGAALESVRFGVGLSDGDVLFESTGEQKKPAFRENMSANEVMEFVVDSLAVSGFATVEPTNLRPARFGSKEGFRFDLDLVSDKGLDYGGFVVGSIIDKRLQLILYTGVKAHHFGKYKNHVDRMIESIQL